MGSGVADYTEGISTCQLSEPGVIVGCLEILSMSSHKEGCSNPPSSDSWKYRRNPNPVHIFLCVESSTIKNYMISVLEREGYRYSYYTHGCTNIDRDCLVIVETHGDASRYTELPRKILEAWGGAFEIHFWGIMTRKLSRSFGELFCPTIDGKYIFADQMHDCDSELRVVFSDMLSRLSDESVFGPRKG